MEKKQNVTLVTAKDSVVDVILKYRACDEWENLLKYVMEPNRVRPLMQSYYAKNGVSDESEFTKVRLAQNDGWSFGVTYVNQYHLISYQITNITFPFLEVGIQDYTGNEYIDYTKKHSKSRKSEQSQKA